MFVGRKQELSLLRSYLIDRTKAQLIILYGRRRIGKSTLIAKAVKKETNVLFFEGIEGARKHIQIEQFLTDLAVQTGRVRLGARNWREVFQGLGELIRQGRWVLVFDEFPWMGGGRSQIVSELKLHWDRWSKNPNICLFLCGSVASFMTRHLVHSKALHNRKTLEMCLGPLTPKESGRFIARRSIREKAQLYMSLGGVPKYLEQIDPNTSLEKNLNRLCFSAGGFFIEEYETLFKEQFRSIRTYESIVKSLADAPASLSDLARRVSVSKGGGFRGQVDNLILAQFVREYTPVMLEGKRRTRTRSFKLIDPFLIFYFRYVHPNRSIIVRNRRGENLLRAIAGPTLHQYYGFAFERLCEDSIEVIIDRLGLTLADIVAMGPFFRQQRGQKRGLQIDWLIVRRDSVWTLIEIKYSATPVGKKVIHDVQRKIERLNVPADISIEPVLISARGASRTVIAEDYFSHILTLDDLL
ncbi:MAG: ATP-binding protein [Deltaproteobacteria bacterium]|nr:ATP-binding protein [Deltaproteobacteria bacterium]